ncbi:hypothetical protein ACE1CD_30150 [Aerosakkonema sp. BLCC-F183]|uniref:hypothetical protein n=1 Tax=Aerosakkonema sp. BLCC-F183 TaxID=3342834 RepID=UPI0035BB6789
MAQCPVCQREYVEGQVNFCTTCGWDLSQYSLTFNIPNEWAKKEESRIIWAKQIWARSQSDLEKARRSQSQLENIGQTRSQLESQVSQLETQLKFCNQEVLKQQSQLEDVKQEKAQLQSQISDVESQLKQSDRERSHLKEQLAKVLSRLQQLSKDRSPDALAILSHLDRRLESQETQLQQAKNSLSHWLPNLTLQLAQELAHIPDKTWATEELDRLIQSWQKRRSISQRHKLELLLAIKSVLEKQEEEKVEKIREYLATTGNNNLITQVDTLLSIRYELKLKGIIKRDIDGDTLYD